MDEKGGGVVPIRPGIRPDIDAAREMADWAAEQISRYAKETGEPVSIAIVINSPRGAKANSWSPKAGQPNVPSRQEACSFAGMLLLRRAMED